MNSTSFDQVPIFKVIFVGNSGSGKTSIITRYIQGDFQKNVTPTIAVAFFRKKISYSTSDNKQEEYWLHVWDTGGQERFDSITPVYMRGSNGAFIVFDLSNRQSFLQIKKWYGKLKMEKEKGCSIVLVGNKSDLGTEKKVIKKEEIEKLKEELDVDYIETSAKEGWNIEEAFELTINKMVENMKFEFKDQTLSINEKDVKKKGCCGKK